MELPPDRMSLGDDSRQFCVVRRNCRGQTVASRETYETPARRCVAPLPALSHERRLAAKPKCPMRAKPRRSTCRKSRRKNSSTAGMSRLREQENVCIITTPVVK